MSSHAANLDLILALGAAVILLSLSSYFRLGLAKEFTIATFRTILQLTLVGYILKFLFTTNSAAITVSVFAVMTILAAQAVWSRTEARSWQMFASALAVLFLSVWPIGLIVLFFAVGSVADAKQAVPFFGLLLGNTLSAISLGLIGLERSAKRDHDEVRTLSALGATKWEAKHRIYREITRSSLTPILNSMTIVGVVSLPGVMAGQLLAGADPISTARFQILIMLATALSSMVGVLIAIGFVHLGVPTQREALRAEASA